MRRVLVLIGALGLGACGPDLPEPTSPGAQVLATRCGGCHTVHAPASMTIAMWDVQLERMRRLFRQRGYPWLAPEEERLLRGYLAKHAGTQ